MIELMPCQLCGGEAVHAEDEYDGMREEWEVVGCRGCGAYGPLSEWEGVAPLSCSRRERAEFMSKLSTTHQKIAARRWNEMQTLIARGKLLDAAPKSKGARL